LIKHGASAYLYGYDYQPLYYLFLKNLFIWLKLPLNFLVMAAILVSLISLLAALWCLYEGVKRLVSGKFALYFIIACLLIPEIKISGAYPNTSVFTLALLCLVFYLLARFRASFFLLGAASAVMAVSFYARSDAVLMAPGFLFLAYYRSRRRYTIALCMVVMFIVWLALLKLTSTSMENIFYNLAIHYEVPAIISLRNAVAKALPLSPLFIILIESAGFLLCFIPLSLAILAGIGLLNLIVSRRKAALCAFAVGFMPLFLLFFTVMTTPKHLLYVYPFIAWLAVEGWLALAKMRQRKLSYFLRLAIIVIFAAQYFFRCGFFGAIVSRIPMIIPGRAGYSAHTHDGMRPLTGIVYFPLTFRENYPFQKNRQFPVFPYARGVNRIYWAKDYLCAGIIFLNLSVEAKKEIADPVGIAFYPESWSKQSFLMPDGSMAMCVYPYLFSEQSKQQHLAYIEKSRKLGFTNIIYSSSAYPDDAFMRFIKEKYPQAQVRGNRESGYFLKIGLQAG